MRASIEAQEHPVTQAFRNEQTTAASYCFEQWQRALAALKAAEARGADHHEIVHLSAEVIRTRNPCFRFDHRKFFLIDGRLAWTGGRTITRQEFTEAHDLTYTVRGPDQKVRRRPQHGRRERERTLRVGVQRQEPLGQHGREGPG